MLLANIWNKTMKQNVGSDLSAFCSNLEKHSKFYKLLNATMFKILVQ